MPGRRLPEPYNVDYFRSAVKDSLSYLGEQVIVLSMYHVNIDKDRPRCACYDDDYETIDNWRCTDCYGTSLAGGVKTAMRVWAMITDTTSTEEVTERGIRNPDKRQVQLEWHPPMIQGDYVVRVPPNRWAPDWATPLAVDAIYKISEVAPNSVRQGQYRGQVPQDLVGQKGVMDKLPTELPIHKFPIVGRAFPRPDGRQL